MFVINRIIIAGLTVSAAICLFVGWNLARQSEISDWVDHTYLVRQQTEEVLERILDAEAAQRSFLFTGTASPLQRYHQVRNDLSAEIQTLRHLTSDNPRQQSRIDRLAPLAETRLRQLDETIQVYRDHGENAARAVVLSGKGKVTMTEIRSTLAEFDEEEKALLKDRIHRRHGNLANETVGTGASLLVGLVCLIFFDRQHRRMESEEKSNRQSKQELRVMLEFVKRAPMGILILDRALRQTQVNQRWLDDFGLSREAVIGKNHYETFPRLPQRVIEAHRKTLAGETLAGSEDVYVAPDGVEHWINWRMVLWGDSGETTGGIIIYSEDLTKRKQAEASALKYELKYRTLFENMPDALAFCRLIVEQDRPKDVCLLTVNPAFSSLVNVSQAAGLKVSEVFPDLDPVLIEMYDRVAMTGTPEKLDYYDSRTGRWLHQLVYSPEHGFFVLLIQDISQRKKEESFAKLWQLVFKESHSGIALVNAQTGKVEAANPAYAKLLEYKTDELEEMNIALIYPENELARREQVLQAVEVDAEHVLFETVHVKKGGTQLPVLVDITVIRNDIGESVSHLKIIHDLTEVKRTREALLISEARAESLFENASQGILMTDSTGLILTANASVQRLFGYAHSEVIGKFIEILLLRDLRCRSLDLFSQPLVPALACGVQLTGRRKDGTEFPLELSISYVGEKELTIVFITDITDRVQGEAALRESEEQFRTLANAIPNLCWMARADGTVFWFNQRWYDYTGTTFKEMDGWGWKSVHEPNNLPRILECWSLSISTGAPFEMTVLLRGADGVFRPFLTRAIPVTASGGKVMQWFGTNTDISHQLDIENSLRLEAHKLEAANSNQMRVSEALRSSEARSRSLLENAGQAILTVNAGRIIDSNAATRQLFGYEVSELIGASIETLLPWLHDEPSQSEAHPFGLVKESIAIHRNGTEFPVEINVSYIGQNSNRMSLTFVSDITARKKSDTEREDLIVKLKDALAEKIVLLQEVHHRVKNNLAIIAALLRMQSSGMEDKRAKLAMEESQQRVLSMSRIHEFLYATKHLDRLDFGKYLEQLTNELLDSYALSSDVQVHVVAEEIDLPMDQAIPCGLILNELLTNAFKYAFPGDRSGEVVVRFFRQEEGRLSLSCSDNGVGIPDNVQLQNSKSLGLRIVRTLTKQINGELLLERSRGTKFELLFPAPQLRLSEPR